MFNVYRIWKQNRINKKVIKTSKKFLKDIGLNSRLSICHTTFKTYIYTDIYSEFLTQMLRNQLLPIHKDVMDWEFRRINKRVG